MSRTSSNPLKETTGIPRKPYISMGIVTHFTDHHYHGNRMDVVHACLSSIVQANDGPDELVIWDNGSTPRFREMLASFMPDVLIESYNVGLDTAKNNLAEIARGKIFCYSDDDILYGPDWLGKHLEILETYPEVGTVSGSPQRVHFRWGNKTAKAYALKEGFVSQEGRFIPDVWEKDYCESINKDYNNHMEQTKSEQDLLLEYKGINAFAHGHHMQFVSYRDTIRPFLKPSGFYMNEHKSFDCAVDEAGLMRLTTFERTAQHIGNKL